MRYSIIIPCFNEATSIKATIEAIDQAISQHDIDYDIIVSDNMSTDQTATIATQAGAKVVSHTAKQQIAATRNF